MAEENKKPSKPMPTGVRKGGTRYPRHALDKVIPWSKKLVSKTHLGPEPAAVIFSAVVGAKSGRGDVRVSALKQFGFLGGKASAYEATDLAKRVNSAPPEELVPLHREAALAPTIFKDLFTTFHGDTFTKAKMKQRAAELDVHPEETENCIDIYLSSMVTAKLATVDGDKATHIHLGDIASDSRSPNEDERAYETGSSHETARDDEGGAPKDEQPVVSKRSRPGLASVTVSITLDSTMDIEKLTKQMEVLRRYNVV